MNLKLLSHLKAKLNSLLKDKEILDVILFGSAVRGNLEPRDIDLALITESKKSINLEGFHVSIINPRDFVVNPPSIINTLLREGYSIKNNKKFSEYFRFDSRVLFTYELKGLEPSKKVKLVNILHGKKEDEGLVKSSKGEWMANQVFIIPVENSSIIEKFLINQGIKYRKMNLLIH